MTHRQVPLPARVARNRGGQVRQHDLGRPQDRLANGQGGGRGESIVQVEVETATDVGLLIGGQSGLSGQAGDPFDRPAPRAARLGQQVRRQHVRSCRFLRRRQRTAVVAGGPQAIVGPDVVEHDLRDVQRIFASQRLQVVGDSGVEPAGKIVARQAVLPHSLAHLQVQEVPLVEFAAADDVGPEGAPQRGQQQVIHRRERRIPGNQRCRAREHFPQVRLAPTETAHGNEAGEAARHRLAEDPLAALQHPGIEAFHVRGKRRDRVQQELVQPAVRGQLGVVALGPVEGVGIQQVQLFHRQPEPQRVAGRWVAR